MKTLSVFLCKLTKRFWVYKATLASYNKLFIVKNHFLGRYCIFSSDNCVCLRMNALLTMQKLKYKYNFEWQYLELCIVFRFFFFLKERNKGGFCCFLRHDTPFSCNCKKYFLKIYFTSLLPVSPQLC